MSATAEELPGADVNHDSRMDETVAYEPKDPSGSGPEDPMGSSDMPKANLTSQAQGRYTFGSGARPLDGYTIKRAIGRGGFGEVYYATSDSGKEVALKLILRNLDVERRGVMQCMNLKCPNLLTIFDLKTSDAGDTFVVMEYVAGPSLASVLKQYPGGLPLAEVRHWLKGLVEGVAYLHDHGIVHRDLKPANLFMEEGIVKIGDYGLAKLITPSQGTEHSESIGTCHYMAPEIGSGKYHKPIDVYAIGVILYEMLTGRVPFDGETVNEVLMKHLTARPDVSMLPQPYQTIVAKALAKDPNQRPSRVYDLLPPEDAPREPRSGSSATARPARTQRLGIGPQPSTGRTRTTCSGSRPRSRSSTSVRTLVRLEVSNLSGIEQRLRANWEALRRPGAAPPSLPPPCGIGRRAIRAAPQTNGAVRQARLCSSGLQSAAPPGGCTTARATPLAQRPGPRRRAGRLDALGRPARGALDHPGRRALGHRSVRPAPAAGLSLRHGAAGHLDRLDPQQGRRDAPVRRHDPAVDLPGRRTARWASSALCSRRTLRLGLNVQQAFFSEPQNLEPVYFGALYTIMGAGCPWRPAIASRGSESARLCGRGSCRPFSSRSGLTTARTASPSRS